MSPRAENIAYALKGAPVLVTKLYDVMSELVKALMTEIEIVSKRQIKEHPEHLKHKQKLAVDYRAIMKAIADQPEIVKNCRRKPKTLFAIWPNVWRKRLMPMRALARGNECHAPINSKRDGHGSKRSHAAPKLQNHAKAHMQLGGYSPTCRPIAISRTV